MSQIIKTKRINQIGFIVKDIEASSKRFAELFGMPVPEIQQAGDYEISKTIVNGQPAPDAKAKLAFFQFDNIQMELIEPNQADSTWRKYLDEHGEGIHHLAFATENTEESVKEFAQEGIEVAQTGLYKTQKGRYTYMSSEKDLHCIVELLENFK